MGLVFWRWTKSPLLWLEAPFAFDFRPTGHIISCYSYVSEKPRKSSFLCFSRGIQYRFLRFCRAFDQSNQIFHSSRLDKRFPLARSSTKFRCNLFIEKFSIEILIALNCFSVQLQQPFHDNLSASILEKAPKCQRKKRNSFNRSNRFIIWYNLYR